MLPPEPDSFEFLPLASKRRIDAIGARFEEAWRTGRPRLETFCAEVGEGELPILLEELLQIEIEYRRRRGEHPLPGDYIARFPGRERLLLSLLPLQPRPQFSNRRPGGKPGAPPYSGQDSSEQNTGPRVPGYEVLEEIGRGGMGVVHKARHIALNRMVALKFVRAGARASRRQQERFYREAEVVARMKHPNIIQIYDLGESDGECYLALEYAELGSLRERLNEGPIEPRLVVMLMEPLARAVQHAHRVGVIHRDLKPANILLTPAGDSIGVGLTPLFGTRQLPLDLPGLHQEPPPLPACLPKLTDFGLAQLLDPNGVPEAPLPAGTPSYMAPEQVGGKAETGPAVDIWAFGATMYEMLTGVAAFKAPTPLETMNQVVETEPEPLRKRNPRVPKELEAICLKCLQKNPANRYPGARELAKDLRDWLDGLPVSVSPRKPITRLLEWVVGHPWMAVGILGAVLLTGMIGGALLFGWLVG